MERASDWRVFCFVKSGHLRNMLKLAFEKCGFAVSAPRRRLSHFLPHLRDLDEEVRRTQIRDDLVRTGRWRNSPKMADRYVHTEPDAASGRRLIFCQWRSKTYAGEK